MTQVWALNREYIAEPTESRGELVQGEVSIAIGIQRVENIL